MPSLNEACCGRLVQAAEQPAVPADVVRWPSTTSKSTLKSWLTFSVFIILQLSPLLFLTRRNKHPRWPQKNSKLYICSAESDNTRVRPSSKHRARLTLSEGKKLCGGLPLLAGVRRLLQKNFWRLRPRPGPLQNVSTLISKVFHHSISQRRVAIGYA